MRDRVYRLCRFYPSSAPPAQTLHLRVLPEILSLSYSHAEAQESGSFVVVVVELFRHGGDVEDDEDNDVNVDRRCFRYDGHSQETRFFTVDDDDDDANIDVLARDLAER